MTIRMLKELIKDLPDDMRVYKDDGDVGMFSNNNEFLTAPHHGNMLVLQTRNDFDVADELDAWLDYEASQFYTGGETMNEQDFWAEFCERGYIPEDFGIPERIAWAKEQLKNYGLN